jgi:ribose 5-phosphate isomerase A
VDSDPLLRCPAGRTILDPVEPDREAEKRLAAEAAAWMVQDSMTVGLGTGTTVAYLLPALARRNLSLRCVATSPRTRQIASELGLQVEPFTLERLDMAIDGADQVAPDGWLVKGGGGAHTREKLVAIAADVFVVIVDSTKMVDAIHPPVPLEILGFGAAATLARIGTVRRRGGPATPDGGVLADFTGELEDPAVLARDLDGVPGIVGHGLFPPELVRTIVIGRGDDVELIELPPR